MSNSQPTTIQDRDTQTQTASLKGPPSTKNSLNSGSIKMLRPNYSEMSCLGLKIGLGLGHNSMWSNK